MLYAPNKLASYGIPDSKSANLLSAAAVFINLSFRQLPLVERMFKLVIRQADAIPALENPLL